MSLARDVKAGFAKRPRSLPPKYFYDALGSRVFEALGELPWYRITASETRLLRRAAPALARALAGPVRVVELGSGSGEKLALVVEALLARRKKPDVHVVDLSAAAVSASLAAPREVSRGDGDGTSRRLRARPSRGDARPARPRADGRPLSRLQHRELRARRCVAAPVCLRGRLRPGDALLLGTDLVKPERVLVDAYDDPLGLTAVFNLNLLLRLNRELGADFDLAAWRHRAAGTRRRGGSRCTS